MTTPPSDTDDRSHRPSRSDRGRADDDLPSLRTALQRRLRLLASGAVVGPPLAPVVVWLWTALGRTVPDAVEATFALGTLALGFGVVGWSGSIVAGRGIETMQSYADTGTDWTERKSRRAMTRVAGLGAGLMLAASVIEPIVTP